MWMPSHTEPVTALFGFEALRSALLPRRRSYRGSADARWRQDREASDHDFAASRPHLPGDFRVQAPPAVLFRALAALITPTAHLITGLSIPQFAQDGPGSGRPLPTCGTFGRAETRKPPACASGPRSVIHTMAGTRRAGCVPSLANLWESGYLDHDGSPCAVGSRSAPHSLQFLEGLASQLGLLSFRS